MHAFIIGLLLCLVAVLYSIFTAKKDPWEEEANKPKEKGKVVRLDEYEAELGGDIAIVDEVQSN